MDKRVLLITSRICYGRKDVKSSILFKYAIGSKRFSIHNVAANNAVRWRKFNIGIIRKTNFIINKERYNAVNKETQKKDNRYNGRLS